MSETRDPYDDQLRSAWYRAERDQALQECERLQRKVECLEDDIENLKLELGEAKGRLRDSVTRDAYENRRAKWLRHIRECETALHKRNRRIAEDRDEVEWVRDRGGLDAVWTRWDNDTQLADAVIRALWPCGMPDGGGNEDVMDELERRLMPEGMEWLIEAWPKFEDDAPVKLGDMALIDGYDDMVEAVQIWIHGKPVIYGDSGSQQLEKGQRVKRPAPTVLAADNEPLEAGQTVWHVATGREYTVRDCTNGGAHLSRDGKPAGYCRAEYLTHQRPVLDAHGVPIREGDTVWCIGGGDPAEVAYTITADASHPDEVVLKGYEDDWPMHADKLTHTKPEPPDSRQAVVNEIGDEMAARIDFLVSSGRWSDAD